MIIPRYIQKSIESKFFKGKAIIIYGARQVGKTTLVQEILKKYPKDSIYLNCDEPDIRNALTDKTSTEIKAFLGDYKLVVLDEAQRVRNIGMTLKLIIDNFPKMQIVATGSSSFELSNKIVEPLTGRKYEFHLFPLSYNELKNHYKDPIKLNRIFERRMIFGMYPDVALSSGAEEKENVKNLTKSYLYKDIFAFQNIQNPEVLEKLLQALALQVGNEVSYNELGQMIGVDKNTVSHYIQILEKAFIIFRLSPFSRNLRNELKKLRKIYFWDTGVRNALINNFNPMDLRQDAGALFENFLISNRIQFNMNHQKDCNTYFWRTHAQQEIDYIEEFGGKIHAYEFKWKKRAYKFPAAFLGAYKGAAHKLIHKENLESFLS
jgi:predicted AAA+ superfamily ATPase